MAVTSTNAPVLGRLKAPEVKIGDLEDLEIKGAEVGLDLVIGNSHLEQSAKRLGLPLLRMGFPQWDLVGGYARTWIGYRGARQALFDMANLLMEHPKGEIEPYVSIYRQEPATHDAEAAAADPRRRH